MFCGYLSKYPSLVSSVMWTFLIFLQQNFLYEFKNTNGHTIWFGSLMFCVVVTDLFSCFTSDSSHYHRSLEEGRHFGFTALFTLVGYFKPLFVTSNFALQKKLCSTPLYELATRNSTGVRQGCLLSPILFNIFLERYISDAVEDHKGTVSIGDRTITNLRWQEKRRN